MNIDGEGEAEGTGGKATDGEATEGEDIRVQATGGEVEATGGGAIRGEITIRQVKRAGKHGSQTQTTKDKIAKSLRDRALKIQMKEVAKIQTDRKIKNAVEKNYLPEEAHLKQTALLTDQIIQLQRSMPQLNDSEYHTKLEFLEFLQSELKRTERDLCLIKKDEVENIKRFIHEEWLQKRRDKTAEESKKRKAKDIEKSKIVTYEDAMKFLNDTDGINTELLSTLKGKKHEKTTIFSAQMVQSSLGNFSNRWKESSKTTVIEDAIALLSIIMPKSKNRIERLMNEKFKYNYYDITFLCDSTTLNMTNVMSLR